MNKYKKLMVITAMTAALGTSAFAASTGITDISNYWGKAAIQYFYNQHYISGTNGQFRPNEDITREGAAAIINNMIGEDSGEDSKVKTTNFSDVKGRWSERAIASLVDKQIMSGYSNGTFKPEQKITREEFAVIAYNYMTYQGMTTVEGAAPFADEAKISTWARQAVHALAAAGYMKGGNYNMFNPKQYVTRGEAVNVLYRIMTGVKVTNQSQDNLEDKAFTNIKDVYGSVKAFANDGIMYWQGNKLHIGVKDVKNRQKLADAIASDKDIPAESVYVQKSTYSYNDYKNLMAQAEKIYKATESTDAAVTTAPDYLNEKVILTVPSISKETQNNLNKALGSALKIVIQ